MNRFSKVLTMVVGCATISACASDPEPLQTTEAVTVLDTDALPVPPEGLGAARLGALDRIRVEVFGIENLTREIQIDASGRISFPFVGSIDVSDRTPLDIERTIVAGLRQGYVKDPVVTVNLVDTQSQTVAVEGEVEKPGIYQAAGELTLLRALALAGGETEFALREQIVIFREVGGNRYAGVYDLAALRRGLIDDPRVFPDDTIVVGESPRRRAIDRILQTAPAITSPLVILFTRI